MVVKAQNVRQAIRDGKDWKNEKYPMTNASKQRNYLTDENVWSLDLHKHITVGKNPIISSYIITKLNRVEIYKTKILYTTIPMQ